MAATKLVNRIAGNFWLRNIVLFIILHAASFFQRVAQKKGGGDLFNALYMYVLFYILVVFHNRVLYERFLKRRKYISYAVLLLLGITIFQALLIVQERYMMHLPFPPHSFAMWVSIYGLDLSYMLLGFSVYYSFHHFKTEHDMLNLQYLRRDLELKQLKEQLNPHFLFNALNNIYSYSLEKNSYSKVLILKLGELMRFILTNADNDTISLGEECTFIENYIAFEKERLGDLCDIVYEKRIADESLQITPFVLFTLVENAFKHGTHTPEASFVHIYLHATTCGLSLKTVNPITDAEPAASTKIGLSNTRRRLALLYPGRHTFSTTVEGNRFIADLNITIPDHGDHLCDN